MQAEAERDEALAELNRLRARVDTLTAVAQSNAKAQRVAYEECERLRAELARIQRWATETVHGSAAAEVLLLIRDLPETAAGSTT